MRTLINLDKQKICVNGATECSKDDICHKVEKQKVMFGELIKITFVCEVHICLLTFLISIVSSKFRLSVCTTYCTYK